jgi:ribonucleoside-diphosphate reductase alpha chain
MNKLKSCVREAVIALNDVLDEGLNLHPLQEQRECVFKYRQIGLGVMGIADMLIKMGMRYGDDDSIKLCDKIASTMLNEAVKESALIAKEYGTFQAYDYKTISESEFYKNNLDDAAKEMVKKYGLRNSQLLTIPPTGSISTMLGISGGIEPIFNISYIRKTETLHDEDVYYKVYTPIVKEYMDFAGITEEKDLPEYFVTAMNIDHFDRIRMQETWQKYIDASISSTINIPYETSVEEVYKIYMKAWEAGLKGVTIFRDGCKRSGILINTKDSEKNKSSKNEKTNKNESINENESIQSNCTNNEKTDSLKCDGCGDGSDEMAMSAYRENLSEKFVCPECGAEGIANTGGCTICLACGYSGCN